MAWLFAALATAPVDDSRPPTPMLELRWTAPPQCPTADEVRAKVIELMQRPLGEDPSRRIVVDGVVSASADEFTLELAVQTDAGTSARSFAAPRCGDLLVPAAVVVAIAVDPHVDAPPVLPEPPDEPAPPPAATPMPEPAEPRATPTPAYGDAPPPPRRPRAMKAVIGVLAGFDAGNLPRIGGTIEGSLGLRLARSRIEIGAMHAFERTERRADDRGGAFRITAARARGCFEPHVKRTSFPICGGVDLGIVRGRGVDLTTSATQRKLWLALVAAAGVVWSPRPRIGLLARAELVVAPARHAFVIVDAPLYTTGAVGTRVVAGVEVRLP